VPFFLSGWLDRDGIDRTPHPKVDAHFRRMSEHPAARKVLAEPGLQGDFCARLLRQSRQIAMGFP
jgi:hypothetical protein